MVDDSRFIMIMVKGLFVTAFLFTHLIFPTYCSTLHEGPKRMKEVPLQILRLKRFKSILVSTITMSV